MRNQPHRRKNAPNPIGDARWIYTFAGPTVALEILRATYPKDAANCLRVYRAMGPAAADEFLWHRIHFLCRQKESREKLIQQAKIVWESTIKTAKTENE